MLFEWFPNDSFVTEGREEAVLLDERSKGKIIQKKRKKIVEEPKEKKKM
jgi:hypothetical protein